MVVVVKTMASRLKLLCTKLCLLYSDWPIYEQRSARVNRLPGQLCIVHIDKTVTLCSL